MGREYISMDTIRAFIMFLSNCGTFFGVRRLDAAFRKTGYRGKSGIKPPHSIARLKHKYLSIHRNVFIVAISVLLAGSIHGFEPLSKKEVWQRVQKEFFRADVTRDGAMRLYLYGEAFLQTRVYGGSTSFRQNLTNLTGRIVEPGVSYEITHVYESEDSGYQIRSAYQVDGAGVAITVTTKATKACREIDGYLGGSLSVSARHLAELGLIDPDMRYVVKTPSAQRSFEAGESVPRDMWEKHFLNVTSLDLLDVGGQRVRIEMDHGQRIAFQGGKALTSADLTIGNPKALGVPVEADESATVTYRIHIAPNEKGIDRADYLKPFAFAKNRDLFYERLFQGEEGSLPYRLYTPANYDERVAYPLVLFLHGAGGRGSDNLRQISGGNSHGTHLFVTPENQAKFPCIVVAPQCPVGEQWVDRPWSRGSYSTGSVPISGELQLVMKLLDSLQEEFNIDPRRIYVTGQSMGGYGTWDLICRFPQKFAAAIPVCGAGDPSCASCLVDMGIWAFHGAQDGTVPVEGTLQMINAIREAGGTPKMTIYEDVGHFAWEHAYHEDGLLEWLFSHTRKR